MTETPNLEKGYLRSALQSELVTRILEVLRSAEVAPEGRIRESVLSRDLGVSRTPIRAALQHLVSQGVLKAHAQGGYVLGEERSKIENVISSPTSATSLYGRILRDIILHELVEPASEKFLERKYGVGRGELLQILRRLVREGLAEPLPGRGWTFLRFDADQMSRSYHLRTIVEPAVLLDRDFDIDPEILRRLRVEQQSALLNLSPQSSWPGLFELDAAFHETLARGSGNELIVDIIKRQNHYRRLAEFFSYSRLDRIRSSMTEHIAIIDALVAGDQRWASEIMRQHLNVSRRETEEHLQGDVEAVRTSSSGIERL